MSRLIVMVASMFLPTQWRAHKRRVWLVELEELPWRSKLGSAFAILWGVKGARLRLSGRFEPVGIRGIHLSLAGTAAVAAALLLVTVSLSVQEVLGLSPAPTETENVAEAATDLRDPEKGDKAAGAGETPQAALSEPRANVGNRALSELEPSNAASVAEAAMDERGVGQGDQAAGAGETPQVALIEPRVDQGRGFDPAVAPPTYFELGFPTDDRARIGGDGARDATIAPQEYSLPGRGVDRVEAPVDVWLYVQQPGGQWDVATSSPFPAAQPPNAELLRTLESLAPGNDAARGETRQFAIISGPGLQQLLDQLEESGEN